MIATAGAGRLLPHAGSAGPENADAVRHTRDLPFSRSGLTNPESGRIFVAPVIHV